MNTTTTSNTTTNITTADAEDALQALNDQISRTVVPAVAFFGLLMLMGIVGNLLVCFVFFFRLAMSTQTCLIVALAVFDLLVSFVAIPTVIAETLFALTFRNEFACRLLRYVKVCHPMKRQMSMQHVRTALVVNVLLSLVGSAPSAFLYGVRTSYMEGLPIPGHDCSINDWAAGTIYPHLFTGLLIVAFFVSLIMLTVFYTRIIRTTKRQGLYMAKLSIREFSPTSVVCSFSVEFPQQPAGKRLSVTSRGEKAEGKNGPDYRETIFTNTFSTVPSSGAVSSYYLEETETDLAEQTSANVDSIATSYTTGTVSGRESEFGSCVKSLKKTGTLADVMTEKFIMKKDSATDPPLKGYKSLYAAEQEEGDSRVSEAGRSDTSSKQVQPYAPTAAMTMKKTVSKTATEIRDIVSRTAVDFQRTLSKTAWDIQDSLARTAINIRETVSKTAGTPPEPTISRPALKTPEAVYPRETTIAEDVSDTKQGTVPQPKMNLQETVSQPEMTIEETASQPKMNILETVSRPEMEMQETVSQAKMNILETVSRPKMNLQATVSQPEMEMQETVSQAKMNILEAVSKPATNEQGTPSRPAMSTQDTVASNNSANACCCPSPGDESADRRKPSAASDWRQITDIQPLPTLHETSTTWQTSPLPEGPPSRKSWAALRKSLSPRSKQPLPRKSSGGTGGTVISPSQTTTTELERRQNVRGRMASEPAVSRRYSSIGASSRREVRSSKTTVTAMCITGAFFLSFVPHLSLVVARNVCRDFELALSGAALVFYNIFLRSYFLNSVCNPVIYGVLNGRFRRECVLLFHRVVLCKVTRKNSPS